MWWSKPSRAGGTPRTERSVELGAPRIEWTPCVDAAKRERGNPQEVLPGEAASLESFGSLKAPLKDPGGGKLAETTLKRAFGSWENEPDGETSGDGRQDVPKGTTETFVGRWPPW
jgi:hypothetical protein